MKDKLQTIAISELKAKLLEVVRQVQAGHGFRISKGGQVVALLSPMTEEEDPVVGFAKVKVVGDILSPVSKDDWNFDLKNIA